MTKKKIAILGCGNIGSAIANGLVKSEIYKPSQLYLTRKSDEMLSKFAAKGFNTLYDNIEAVKKSEIIIIAVTPQQLNALLEEIDLALVNDKHVLLSVVTGVSIKQIKSKLTKKCPVVRVMPNTAIAIQESMTCLSANDKDHGALEQAKAIFDQLGKTVVIHEELMVPATALCASGIAFFLRAIRAASQGGIEIGFHAEDALFMAAQTAKGAASLILENGQHPEGEVDKVTTPLGITISGLNQMEHAGFSSSLIKGLVTSAEKAKTLYSEEK
ncbi:MAG: PCA reductase [Ignavibacteria bacterium]|nr:MAG: PCA reductase [Ignavibacteria bacterium]KAF0161448.1 MAG: PCA reductase [Ignavibacteria bacterium]